MYSVPVDGGTPRHLLDEVGDQRAGSWSPDGRWIVYSSGELDAHDLYIMSSDGGEVRPLRSGTEENEITPDWWAEPDGVITEEPGCSAQPVPSPVVTPSTGPS